MATAVWEHIDAFVAHDLAEQDKLDAEGSCLSFRLGGKPPPSGSRSWSPRGLEQGR